MYFSISFLLYPQIYIKRRNEVEVRRTKMGQDETRMGGAAPGAPTDVSAMANNGHEFE